MKKLIVVMVSLIILLSYPSVDSFGIRYKNRIFSSVDITRDVIYGQNYVNGTLVKLKMDIYEPHGDTAVSRALVICIHGGGFTGGDKSNKYIAYICKDLAMRGYVAASINYRLQPKGNINYGKAVTDAMYDAKAAVRYFRAHAAQWRIDTSRIAILGSSAGAITALHACYLREAKYEGDSGNSGYSSNVSACIDMWGGLYKNVSEIDAGEPPVLIIHGTDDKVVPFTEALNITKQCDAVGVSYELHALEGEGHAPWHLLAKFIPWIVNFLYAKMIGVKDIVSHIIIQKLFAWIARFLFFKLPILL